MNCFQFRGKRVCRNDAFSFCFSSVSCFSFLCQEKRTTSFFPPPTHILESVLLTNAFAGRTDVSSLPLERTRYLRHRNKAVLPDKCDSVHAESSIPPTPSRQRLYFFLLTSVNIATRQARRDYNRSRKRRTPMYMMPHFPTRSLGFA